MKREKVFGSRKIGTIWRSLKSLVGMETVPNATHNVSGGDNDGGGTAGGGDSENEIAVKVVEVVEDAPVSSVQQVTENLSQVAGKSTRNAGDLESEPPVIAAIGLFHWVGAS